jgi:hypothetical protein
MHYRRAMSAQRHSYYYLDELNLGRGPVDAATIAGMLRAGNLLVWRKGLADWTKATVLPEFAHCAAPPPHATLAELLQLCRHVLRDGVIENHEADQIKRWIATHPEVIDHWPGNVLAARLTDIYRDHVVTDVERAELRDILGHIIARHPKPAEVVASLAGLPLDQPPPVIQFPQKKFCLAGRMVYGGVERCFAALRHRHAELHLHPQWDTDYIVVGGLEADQKLLEQAIRLRKLGAAAKIITEEHWANALARG